MSESTDRIGHFSRRSMLHGGLAAAAGLLLAEDRDLQAAKASGGTLQLFEKAAVQSFPWGSIRWLMNGQIDPQAEMTLGIVEVAANQLNPAHIHPNSAEYLHMLSGACEHLLGDRWIALKPGDTLRIPKNVPHRARTNDQPMRALIIYDTPTRQMVPVK